MATTCFLKFSGRLKAFESELADRFEHGVSGFDCAYRVAIFKLSHSVNEVFVDKRREDVEPYRRSGHGVGVRLAANFDRSIDREPAGKYGKPAKERAFFNIEEVVAPSDRITHGLQAG